ncbi:preprotein translocase subunit SecA [bacterium]|nr:preprotein translocase subunit SecA [bacterium]
MSFLDKFFGPSYAKELKRIKPIVREINALEAGISALSDAQLKEKTQYLKNELSNGKILDDILPEAFALVREASQRTLGLRHYDVQLIGGVLLHKGRITEMRTGEGKTLVGTLPAYLNALSGNGVHVITVNDYLSRRDAVWMGQIYNALGLSVGVVNHEASYMYNDNPAADDEERDEEGSYKVVDEYLKPCERPEAYRADVTYGTNNEFGFDYLRDNIEFDASKLRQRGHNFAIVDEIDSILIDEARTPLIISAPAPEGENLYQVFTSVAKKLKLEEHFTVDEKLKTVALTDAGIEKAEEVLGIENIYTDKGIKYVHHLETAVRAEALFTRDKEYVVRDGEVVIVDEFTGRMQPGRRWSDGLHQAIEAKEGVSIQRETRTYASITYQNYFRQYDKLSGMTGTALTSSEEFYTVYGLEVVPIPTNQPIARLDHNDLIYQTEEGKFSAIISKVKELNQKGQPVLIGTASIDKNELLSEALNKAGINHQMLNAKNHEQEGEIIAAAGRKGAVTLATNMAGRGVDIKLGGPEATEEEVEEMKVLGGLFVLGTERHEARRIDNQLRGRSGRQGDPGETQFYVSMEDTLMRVFGGDRMKRLMGTFKIPADQPIENSLITKQLETAQTRIEGFHFDSRKQILAYDDVINQHRKTFYARRYKLLLSDQSEVQATLDDMIQQHPELEKIVEEKKNEFGAEQFMELARKVMLQVVDTIWVEHLEVMQYTRSSVSLRAYGQRDPLNEYRKEGTRLFNEMQFIIFDRLASIIPNLEPQAVAREEESMRKEKQKAQASGSGGSSSSNLPRQTKNEPGRNDLVTIVKGDEQRTLKYKKAQDLLNSGEWQLK